MQSPARESTLTWKANEFTNDVKALGQVLVERGSADAAQGAQIGEWLRVSGLGEGGGDALVDRALLGGLYWS